MRTFAKVVCMSAMKVFVTGASGFVGTQLTSFLRHQGDSVVALSRSSASDEKIRKASDVVPTKGLPPEGKRPEVGTIQIVRGDLTAEDVLTKGERKVVERGCRESA